MVVPSLVIPCAWPFPAATKVLKLSAPTGSAAWAGADSVSMSHNRTAARGNGRRPQCSPKQRFLRNAGVGHQVLRSILAATDSTMALAWLRRVTLSVFVQLAGKVRVRGAVLEVQVGQYEHAFHPS